VKKLQARIVKAQQAKPFKFVKRRWTGLISWELNLVIAWAVCGETRTYGS
jgi:hypothetical protein